MKSSFVTQGGERVYPRGALGEEESSRALVREGFAETLAREDAV
jgi:hypothetical protein